MATEHPPDHTGQPTERRAHRDRPKDEAEIRAIMRAAYRLIGRNDSTSVQDILDEAGLSTRAFYRHFASKDELIIAMYRADSQRATAELAGAIAAATTPARAVEAWIDHWLALSYDPRRTRRVRVLSSTEARSAVGLRAVEGEDHLTSVTLLARVLGDGRDSGAFPLAQPDDDARSFQAIVAALLHARLHREAAPTQAAARAHLCSLIGRALGCPLCP